VRQPLVVGDALLGLARQPDNAGLDSRAPEPRGDEVE
jgi:hypothetical protein